MGSDLLFTLSIHFQPGGVHYYMKILSCLETREKDFQVLLTTAKSGIVWCFQFQSHQLYQRQNQTFRRTQGGSLYKTIEVAKSFHWDRDQQSWLKDVKEGMVRKERELAAFRVLKVKDSARITPEGQARTA